MQDKGGLIPIHNSASYGHVDIAALLIKHGTIVNAVDKWGFTPVSFTYTSLILIIINVSPHLFN